MSAKTIIVSYNVVPPIAGNLLSTLQSMPTNVQMVDDVAYSLSWTGAPFGTFTFQCSNDYTPGTFPNDYPLFAGNWVTYTLSNTITASGTPDAAFVDLPLIGAKW